MKLTSILIILLFAFTLAACGGGGSSGPAAPETPTTPETPMVHEVDLTDLTVAAGTYEVPAGDTLDVGAGDTEVTLSCPGDTACTVTVDEDGMATSTGGEVTAALSAAATQAIADRKAMAANAATKAAAMRIAGLIDPMSERPDANTSEGDQGLSIVTLPTPANAVDNFSEPMFQTTDGTTPSTIEFMASADMPAMIDGWTGGTYTHTSKDGNTMHTVVKYNDKAADKDASYSTFFSSENIAADGHRAGDAVNAVDANGMLTIDTSGSEVATNHELFSGNFGPTTEGTYSFPGNAEITGMFRGVPGTFECTSPCTSAHDKDGNLSGLTGTWTFEPDGVRNDMGAFLENDDNADPPTMALTDALKAIMVPGIVQDADYMIFGYWMESVTDDEGETTEKMLPFADGKRDYGPVTAVEETATYTGPATGLYMKKTLTPQGAVNQDGPFASGQFTADAMLEANFGGSNVAANHQFSVTGTISNFMDGDTAIDEDWMVNLNREMIGTAGSMTPQKNIGIETPGEDGTGANDMFSGVTDGGMLDDGASEGSWSGTFHGASSADADQPTSASGIFDAHFTNGHVRGAFATNIVEDK